MATIPRMPGSRIMKNHTERAEPDNGISATTVPRVGKIQTDPLERTKGINAKTVPRVVNAQTERLDPKKGINAMSVPQIAKSRVELKHGTKHQSQQPLPDSTSRSREQRQQKQQQTPPEQKHAQEKEPLKSNSDTMSIKTTLLPSLNDSLGHVRGGTLSAKHSFQLEVDRQIDPLRSKIVSLSKKAEQGQNRIDLEKAKAERRKLDEDILNAISMECVMKKIAKMNEQFVKDWNEIDNKGSQS
ncbi:uncharacterized protein LOC125952613 [Anopheles darlingi]|uniref:uncharacterized protein LOC125952613 n=1 Tax=Anopheles darlingi TaxID=43151 RepID=UPI0021005ACB|nr:uncharacterized protein LOC125952613 [Anopheles darlingi]